jgi:CHAD domain-containing protein
MADGKWITELTAETPLPDAARRTLSVRLQVVHDYLPLAQRRSEEDLEYVHQLRVGTRRAGAALDIFSLCMPMKDYRSARKQLRRIRRAAGAARDWDVFLEGLAGQRQSERAKRVHDLLIGYALAQRTVAQEKLGEAAPNYPFDFERLMAETIAAVHKPHGAQPMETLRDLAGPLLSERLRDLHTAATGNLNDYDHLHQVRITGKRVRYAMEVFADCFVPAFREELYPRVEEMQEILGNANDSHVAYQRLEELRQQLRVHSPGEWRRFRPGLDALMRQHQQRVMVERQRFLDWWEHWQQSGGESAFQALLKTPEAQQAS